jgi:hypothetical protein
LPDPDQFHAYEKVDKVNFYPENFNILFKILKNYDTFDTDKKDKS